MLILTSLEKALHSLRAALEAYNVDPANDFIRDACIQRFEFTYELSHKMLKRHLETTAADPSEMDRVPFQSLIRIGFERGLLLNSWDHWKLYRTARGTTSHTYDENKAKAVFDHIPDFYAEANHLYTQLKAAQQVEASNDPPS